MKAIIQINAIKNNPVTTEDVDIAQKIFGPNIATLKGKTTRCTPVPIIEDRIKIPRELITTQYAITLCIDDMKVNDIGFLTTTPRILCIQQQDISPICSPAFIASVCSKYSKSIPWEDSELL